MLYGIESANIPQDNNDEVSANALEEYLGPLNGMENMEEDSINNTLEELDEVFQGIANALSGTEGMLFWFIFNF